MSHARWLLPTIAAAWIAAACNDPAGIGPVARIEVNPSDTTLKYAFRYQFRASLLNVDGELLRDRTVEWNSSDTGIIVTYGDGTVTAKGPGSAYLIATAEGVSDSALVEVRPLRLASVDGGSQHSCAIDIEGVGYCWGSNGQLGNGSVLPSRTPSPISGNLLLRSISVRGDNACGVTIESRAYCWGADWSGQLGNGPAGSTIEPDAVIGDLFTSVQSGGAFTCGISTQSAALCWGFNLWGNLGTGDTLSRDIPTPVVTSLRFKQLAVGPSYTCGLTETNVAYCWGSGGSLGDGSALRRLSPSPVSGDHRFAFMSAGNRHACAVTTVGAAFCWGNNRDGQLGDGTTIARSAPVAVTDGHVFTDIAAANGLTCGIVADSTAYCWGRNRYGELGQPGGLFEFSSVPIPVSGGHKFTSLDAAHIHACGIATDSIAYCWGWGQLAIGVDATSLPLPILGQQ